MRLSREAAAIRGAPFRGQHACAPGETGGGGTRPIAIGDTLRRVLGKTLLRHPESVSEISCLRPLQLGVGVKFAAETIAHSVQAAVRSLPQDWDWVVAQVDVSNTFNCIDRTTLLSSATQRVPALYNWLAFSYRGGTNFGVPYLR